MSMGGGSLPGGWAAAAGPELSERSQDGIHTDGWSWAEAREWDPRSGRGQGGVGKAVAELDGGEFWKHGAGNEEGWEALTRMSVAPGLAVSPSSAPKETPLAADRDRYVALFPPILTGRGLLSRQPRETGTY